MSTVLKNDKAPLGVWILVIVIGSLLIIGLLIIAGRCLIQKRSKRRSRFDIEAGAIPTRKLTLRDGRVVSNEKDTFISRTKDPLLMTDAATPSSQGTGSTDWRSISKPGMVVGQDEISPATPSSSSLQTTPTNKHYSHAPRLSLGSFVDKDSLTNFSSVSDFSVISKPTTAVTAETRESRTINFSRPQLRPPSMLRRNRLSVVNEATPRNSFINRIVSWAGVHHETDDRRPQMQEHRVSTQVSETQTQLPSAGDNAGTIEALEQDSIIKTPELPVRNPSRMTISSDEATLSGRSRSSSVSDVPARPTHSRNESGTNFSRKRACSTSSRTSSIVTTTILQQANVADHSRTSSNTSWFEEPQATLSGPFDAPASLVRQASHGSTWSGNTKPQVHHGASASIQSAHSDTSLDIHYVPISNVRSTSVRVHPPPRSNSSHLESSAVIQTVRASSEQSHYRDRGRSRSRSRSRGPTRVLSKNGHHVLSKRSSLQNTTRN